jgi:hypothetical protein
MGHAISVSITDVEQETLIGQGATAKVYRKGDRIIKRSKMLPGTDTDTFRELRFFGWIESLSPDEQRYFSRMFGYRIYRSDFEHIYAYAGQSEEDKKAQEERNKSKWTMEITSEYKGRPLVITEGTTMTKRYMIVIQALDIIQIMKKHRVAHVDLGLHNVVIDNGNIACIDYGETYMEGDEQYYIHESEHTMLTQLVNAMMNIKGTFAAIEGLRKQGVAYEFTDWLDEFGMIKKEAPHVYTRLQDFLDKNDYRLWRSIGDNPVPKRGEQAESGSDFTEIAKATMDNLCKLYAPELHRKIYKIETVVPNLLLVQDVQYIYDHWGDLPNIKEYFQNKIK